MRVIRIAILLVCGFICYSCDASQEVEINDDMNLLKEILSVRELNKKDIKVNINEVVRKYIHRSMSVEDAIRILEDNNFTYRMLDERAPNSDIYDQIFLATYDTRGGSDIGFGDVVKITLGVNKGKVEEILGVIVYMHM